jgi:hypothetical protein
MVGSVRGVFMGTATTLITDREVKKLVTREDIVTIATLCDQHGTAVSFGFGHFPTPDNAHHEEVIAIKGLVQEPIAKYAPEPAPIGLTKDLEHILAVAEEVRHGPARLRLVFACRDQGFWREFDLPSAEPQSFLHVGRRFQLAPLILAMQSLAPYCVAILESGKARAFMVRGTEIEEMTGTLAIEKLSLPVNDPRVGWSKHVLKGRTEHEKGYFKSLSHQLLLLISKQHARGLVIGCHEDLWGEVEPQFAYLENVLMGRFHLSHFDAEPVQVLRAATPVFAEGQKKQILATLHEITETPSREAVGAEDVLEALLAGRAQKLVVGHLPGQTISECKACGRMTAVAGRDCASCGNAEVSYMAAEEGLIRQALLTDAEVLFVEKDALPGFNGAVALLRY